VFISIQPAAAPSSPPAGGFAFAWPAPAAAPSSPGAAGGGGRPFGFGSPWYRGQQQQQQAIQQQQQEAILQLQAQLQQASLALPGESTRCAAQTAMQ
jgi:hypothetical protein